MHASKQQGEEYRTRVSIRHEPLTYRSPSEGGEYSYFADSWQKRMGGHPEADKRLEKHAQEVRYELPRLEARIEREQRGQTEALGVEYERRVNPQSTQGFGGYFTPPLWAIADFATAPRPERVISRHFTCFNLPAAPGISSVNLPKVTTGATENAEPDVAPTADTDIVDASATANLALVAGQQDVSIQLLEQSPRGAAHLDEVLWKELAAAYDATVESQVWVAGGGAVELNGILNAGIGAITTAEAVGVKIFAPLGETFGFVSDKRKLSPTAYFMRGGRWATIATALDEQKRPLYVPLDIQSSQTANPIGVLLGVPVWLTESVPTNLGTAKNQDCLVAARPEGSYCWESAPTLSLFDDDALAGTLQARIVLRAYVGVIHRYPTAYCSLTGWQVVTNL
jgi:HK97 family phage major capsid protein